MSDDQEPQIATLNKHVTLLAPSFSYWQGRYQLPSEKTTIAVGGESVDSTNLTTPRVKLMTNDWPKHPSGVAWLKLFSNVHAAYSSLIQRFSIPFPIHGVRIIPRAATISFMSEMFGPVDHSGRPIYNEAVEKQSPAYVIQQLASEFDNNYSDILAEIKQKVDPTLFNFVEAKIPTRQSMRGKFGIEVVPVGLVGGTGSVLDQDALNEYRDLVRAAISQKVSEALDDLVSQPREELAVAVNELQTLIARNGRVTAASFNGIRRAIEKIRAFDFVADDTLLAQITLLESRVNETDAADVRTVPSIREGLLEVTRETLAVARDEIAQQAVRRSMAAGRALTVPVAI